MSGRTKGEIPVSYKDSNDNQDTLKLKALQPQKNTVKADEHTRVYRTDETDAARRQEAKRRAAQSAANRNAGQQNSAANTQNTAASVTHKKRRVTAGASSRSQTPHSGQRTAGRPASSPAARPASVSRQASPVPASPSRETAPVSSGEGAVYSNVQVRKKRRRKKEFSAGTFLKITAGIIAAVFLIYSGVVLSLASKLNAIETTGNYINDPDTMLYSSEVKNILVIGEDTRDIGTRGLSDSMILISVNKKKHKLQMTSFMRDIYTEIDGYDYDKLNAAYSFGGAELLKDTIEDNFKIRIDGCVTVNFIAVAHMIDAVGGVEITLSADEANAVNEILYNEVNEIMGDDDPYSDFLPVEDGTYMLDGRQALSYSRIRYVGDADFERTQRQRTVITQMMKQARKINPVRFSSGMNEAVKYIGTDMSIMEIYLLSLRLPVVMASYKPEQLRVPAEGTWSFDETWDGMSIITVDFYANTDYLRQNLYLTGTESQNTDEQ